MLDFVNDYSEGAHEKILQRLLETNMEKLSGYGTDKYCESAKQKIREACENISVTLAYEVKKETNQLIFTVTDTGIGIPIDEQEHVFERFVKLDNFSQGAGLGLSICRIVAERLGGFLIIDREYTQGTRFIFCVSM